MSEDEFAIRSVVASWVEATRTGDIQAVLNLMTDDALFLVPGQPPMDKATFEASSRAQVAAKLAMDAVSEIREVHVDGNMAYMWSHLEVTVIPPGAVEPIKRAGHALTIFRRVGGSWLLHRDANMLARIQGDRDS